MVSCCDCSFFLFTLDQNPANAGKGPGTHKSRYWNLFHNPGLFGYGLNWNEELIEVKVNDKDILAKKLKFVDEYNAYKVGEQRIIQYESHRFILPVLWMAREVGLIDGPVNIVYFDRHPDALEPPEIKKKSNAYNNMVFFDQVLEYTRTKMSICNDDWVKMAMNMGLVKDALLIGGDSHIPQIFDVKYIDSNEDTHLIKRIPSLAEAFKDYRHWDNPSMQKILGVEYDANGLHFDNRIPLWLDLDLDYFTCMRDRQIYAWHDELFNAEFDTENAQGWSGRRFFYELFKKSPIVTVARETMFCGGQAECDFIWLTILEMLKRPLGVSKIKKL